MKMIVARSETNKTMFPPVYVFSTFFYPLLMDVGFNAGKRWTKKVDLFAQSLILIPVQLGMHWYLSTIDMDAKTIHFYDSMGGNNKGNKGNIFIPPSGALGQEGLRAGLQRVEAADRQEDPAADERI